MSRPERINQLLSQILHETNEAFDEYWQMREKCNDLETENEKLHELVNLCMPRIFHICGRCEHNDECRKVALSHKEVVCLKKNEIKAIASELGIEVPS